MAKNIENSTTAPSQSTTIKLEESAMAVVVCKDKILTIRELVYGKEVVSLPKGHTEVGETSLNAAIRECFEETNICIDQTNLVKALTPYSYEFFNTSNTLVRKTLIPYLFEVSKFGTPLPKEERMLSVQWMDIDTFLSLCPYENVKNVVNEALC